MCVCMYIYILLTYYYYYRSLFRNSTLCSVFLCAEKCCADLMSMAKEARKHKLGPLHPAFNLLQIVRDSMEASLPEDAHIRASGKLCVSLTRVSDRKNVLVSQFDSRDELIEVYFTTVIQGPVVQGSLTRCKVYVFITQQHSALCFTKQK